MFFFPSFPPPFNPYSIMVVGGGVIEVYVPELGILPRKCFVKSSVISIYILVPGACKDLLIARAK